jgi:hypothetical protein
MKSDRTINILPLVLLLAIITTTVVVENVYAQSDEKQTAPSERVMINNELEQIPELFTYTKWEDNSPTVLIAAANALADYHALAVPHLADDKDYTSQSKYLTDAMNTIIGQMDKFNLKRDKKSVQIIVDFKDIISKLYSKLNEWPTTMVWSSAERVKEDGPARIPEDKLLVHRGFDIANFFLSEVIGDSLNFERMPQKLDQLLFFEMYCKQLQAVLQQDNNANVQQCEDVQYLETLRVESNLFMLQAQAAKAVQYLEKALSAVKNSDKEGIRFNVQQAVKLMKRTKEKQESTLLNLAHKQRAVELFASESEPKSEL